MGTTLPCRIALPQHEGLLARARYNFIALVVNVSIVEVFARLLVYHGL